MPLLENVREKLANRPTLFLNKPLITMSGLHASVHGFNSGVDQMIAEQQQKWRQENFTEHQIEMATNLATEWAYSMSGAFAPPEMREASFKHALPKGLSNADSWLHKMLRGK